MATGIPAATDGRRSRLAVLFSREAAPYWLMFAIALALRAAHQLLMSRHDPMYGFLLTGGDNHTFDRWALEISQTFWLGWDRIPFFHGPLYPYFLGLLYLRFGHSHDAAAWAQRLLGAVTVVLIFYLARRLFGKRAGWFAGLGAAGCPVFLFFEGELLAETLVLLLNVATLCLLVHAGKRKTAGWWALCGLGLGLCCLGRPNTLLLLPAAACWAGAAARRGVYNRTLAAAAVLVVAAATIAPATLLNHRVGGQFHLVSYSGGFNAYIGNAPDAIGIFCTPPSMARIREMEGKHDKDINWRAHLLRVLRDAPGALPRNLWLKTRLFWQSGELHSNVNFYLKRPFSPFLWLPLRWAATAPLGLVGMLLAFWRRPPKTAEDARLLLAGYLFFHAVSIILIFVLGRLRLPALAILFVFAGYALAELTRSAQAALRQKTIRPLSVVLVILVAWATLGWALKTRDDALLIRWNDHFNLGSAFEAQGRYEEALRHYEQALERAAHITALREICADMRERVKAGGKAQEQVGPG